MPDNIKIEVPTVMPKPTKNYNQYRITTNNSIYLFTLPKFVDNSAGKIEDIVGHVGVTATAGDGQGCLVP